MPWMLKGTQENNLFTQIYRSTSMAKSWEHCLAISHTDLDDKDLMMCFDVAGDLILSPTQADSGCPDESLSGPNWMSLLHTHVQLLFFYKEC